MRPISSLTAALAVFNLPSLTNAKYCPPLGAVLPPPQAPSKNAAVKAAAEKLTSRLADDFASKLNTSGISVGVKSIHEDEQLFSYHFTPPVLSDIGTRSIDENTIFRVGSLSKMMPALAALQSDKIDMSASVLKYIPELEKTKLRSKSNPINTVSWNDVTVGSLASHLSGLATDTAMDLAIFPSGPWTQMGLPEVPKGTGPSCSGLPGTKPCSKQDLIDNINSRPPVYSSYKTPVYSNIGFAILGMVIEAATGQDLNDVFQSDIFDVAGMNSTSFNGPVSSFSDLGFVPQGESTWNVTLGVYEPTGGMFSSTVDIISFAEAILKNRMLSPRQTREWLKPDTHTSSLGSSVGAPWEILRSNSITSDGRVVDVYTKSGDLGLYHALMGVIPDYDIVLSVFAAGAEVSMDPNTRSKIFSAVVESLIPAIEEAGREEASSSKGFVGSYSDESSNSSLTLKMDPGPGLVVSNFTVRGFDVLNHISLYSLSALESGLSGSGTPYVEARMYPTELTGRGSKCKNGTMETAWRAVFDTATPEQKDELEKDLFYVDGSCDSWFGLDRSAYNFLSLAEFVFLETGAGEIIGVKNPAFNVSMTKTR